MTGEMSSSEVTREAYPGLFTILDRLVEQGASASARPFDQYQGPYLDCHWMAVHFQVWYGEKMPWEYRETFVGKYKFEGKDQFYSFNIHEWDGFLSHLKEMFYGDLGKQIASLTGVKQKALEESFENDVRKFLTWKELGYPMDLYGEPTTDETIPIFKVHVRSTCNYFDGHTWEKLEDKIGWLLQSEGLSGHVESEVTGNRTCFGPGSNLVEDEEE